jgi:hypothetical protein
MGFKWQEALAANVHGYFLLGVALAGAMLTDALARWLAARFRAGPAPGVESREGSRDSKRFACALAGMLAASLCNPNLAAGLLMPIRTAIFLARHGIAGQSAFDPAAHPWATIGEFRTPFGPELLGSRVTIAYVLVLCLSGAGAIAALARGRWGWLLALAGMIAVSLNMRRNLAVGAMVLVPLSAIALGQVWARRG